MFVTPLNQSLRMSDAMERDYARHAFANGEIISVTSVGKDVLAALKHGLVAFWSYVIDVTEALNEARAQDSRFSRSQW